MLHKWYALTVLAYSEGPDQTARVCSLIGGMGEGAPALIADAPKAPFSAGVVHLFNWKLIEWVLYSL